MPEGAEREVYKAFFPEELFHNFHGDYPALVTNFFYSCTFKGDLTLAGHNRNDIL